MGGRAYARSTNIPRIAGAAALGAAAVLALAGCIPLPSLPQAPTQSAPTTTTPATTEPTTDPRDALVDTEWLGSSQGPESSIEVAFTFEEDGTLYITEWSGQEDTPYDDATDTWSVDGSTLEITLSNIREIDRIDFTGTYSDSSTIELTGTDGVGTSGYTLTLTQR